MELDGKYRHELKYKIHFSEYSGDSPEAAVGDASGPSHMRGGWTYRSVAFILITSMIKPFGRRLTGSRNGRNFVFVIIMTGFLLLRWKRRSSTTASV